MMNLDDFNIADMRYILNEDTTLSRFYSLIPVNETLIEQLLIHGVNKKSEYDILYVSDTDKIPEITGMERDVLDKFHALLHLHDFKNRSLKELKSMNEDVLEKFFSQGYKKSFDILKLSSEQDEQKIAELFGVNVAEVRRLVGLCQLMRLPGVKDTRASLYYDAGLESLRAFSEYSFEEITEKIALYLKKTGSDKSMPLRKELLTQIAVSKILPI